MFTRHLHPPNLLEDFVAHQSHPDKSSKDEELDKWVDDIVTWNGKIVNIILAMLDKTFKI